MRAHRLADLPEDLQLELAGIDASRSGLMCPACNGGRTRERSLGVHLDIGYLTLSCFRAGCGYFARVFDNEIRIEAPRFKPRVYKGNLYTMDRCSSAAGFLRQRYGILPEAAELFCKWTDNERAVYFTVYGPTGGERGGVMRYFDGTLPKTISYKQTDEPFIGWYLPDGSQDQDAIVIVEDSLSAMRCWQLGYTAVALLGTSLSQDKVDEITGYTAAKFWLALDKDAWPKACGYARRWPQLVPVLLERDLKDGDDNEIERRLR